MNEVRVIIDDSTRELLEDAAKRTDTDFYSVVRNALVEMANIEYAKQQQEDAKTC